MYARARRTAACRLRSPPLWQSSTPGATVRHRMTLPKVEPEYFTTREAARLLHVSLVSVQRWQRAGRLKSFMTPGGHRRIPRGELVRFMREGGMEVPPELQRRLRLLIIDDEPQWLTNLVGLLKRGAPALDVELAESAMSGLFLLGLRKPDAVLLDAAMPGLDGLQVCALLKATPETARIAVIGTSGYVGYEERFLSAGADAFLPKPITAKDVLEVLARIGVTAPRVAAPS